MITYNFILCNIIIFIYLGLIFIIRKALDKNIFPKYLSFSNIFIVLSLLFIFVPNFEIYNFYNFNNLEKSSIKPLSTNIISDYSKDLYVSVNRYHIIDLIIIFGFIIKIIFVIISGLKLRKLNKKPLYSNTFNKLCENMKIKAKLYLCDEILSPLSYGIFFKKVLVPTKYSHDKSIFLHELIHHKHKDLILNFMLSLIECIYWFNPMVLIWCKKIRLDMEVYCDYDVINFLGNNIEYGNIILDSVIEEKSVAQYMFSPKNQLKYRINKIINYNKNLSKIKSRFFIFFVIAFIIPYLFNINSYGYSIYFKPNIEYENINLEKYFHGFKGTFVMYDINNDKYYIYNKNLAEKRAAPNSIYKIVIGINALENKVISPENNSMAYNGKDYPFNEWEQNQNLSTAMKYSVNWYFQNLDNNLTINEIKNFLNKINYGNKSLSFNKESYWLEDTLKISPIEEVIFLKKLFNNEFNFKEENLNCILNSIKINNGYYGKTGSGMINGKINSGWFVSITDRENSKFITALRIENGDGNKAKEISEKIMLNLT
ncbi:MAG: M56 family metallopeptidase [Lachnospirales bacterium]